MASLTSGFGTMGRQSVILGLLCCMTLLYNTPHVVAVNATLLSMDLISNVTASTTSTYAGHNYSPSNVIDGKSGTLPDVCECCWSSANEDHPWLQVDLTTGVNIDRILVKGRSDAGTDATKMLSGLQVFANGAQPPVTGTLSANDVTVRGPIAGVTSLRFQRDRPQSKSYWFCVICELEIYVSASLVSMDSVLSVTPSSVVSFNNHDYRASNVFDQNAATLPDTCNCCWSSDTELNPWLRVVLISPLIVEVIYVKGRSDAVGVANDLTGLQVDVNSIPLSADKLSQVSPDVHVRPGLMAVRSLKFRRVQTAGHSGAWFLAICELEIYWIGACPPGNYGDRCTPCGHCVGGAVCNATTGRCPGRCVGHYEQPLCQTCPSGYYGDSCTQCGHCAGGAACNANTGQCPGGCIGDYQQPLCQVCIPGRYGVHCQSTCGHCNGGNTCDSGNGHCSLGCAPGYKATPLCQIACDDFDYGDNCMHTCHNCYNSVPCNKTTGACPSGCKAGFKLWDCNTECRPGKFGLNCVDTCGHCTGGGPSCDKRTGHCARGCMPGYKATQLCNTACDDFDYGDNCIRTCHNCYNSVPCNKTTGACPSGCKAGFKGSDCNTECIPGEYGVNCANACGHCTGGGASCDKMFGHCAHGCTPGYKDTQLCNTACDSGLYGQDCSESCGHCATATVCNKVDGTCPRGCSAGYTGGLCKQECPNGTYGVRCANTCGGCRDNAVCNKVNGICPDGCSCGYTGAICTACPAGTFGDHCASTCHCETGSLCDTCTGHCSGGCALGWFGFNCSIDANLLQHIHQSIEVSMSSIYNHNNASLALNGFHGPPFDKGTACSITLDTVRPWWQLDLGALYLIADIQMIGRKEKVNEWQSLNVDIYVGNETIQSAFEHGTLIHDTEDRDDVTVLAQFNPPRLLQYIEIARSTPSYLTICEVRVFQGDCPLETYGDNCTLKCHCRSMAPCDGVIGTCPGLCAPGWKGDDCSIVCDHGTFGDNCSSECHCKDGASCPNVNGICPGYCAPGWTGTTCSDECDHGTFGANCSLECNCKNGADCNNVNGTCPGDCAPGWTGTTCSDKCSHGTYGDGCSLNCHCKNGLDCDNVNGTCSGGLCAPGWMDTTCSRECGHRKFGDGCMSSCHCVNNGGCKPVTGTCLAVGCDPGWIGNTCSDECGHQKFGNNCSKTCHCSNNKTCNNVDGNCLGQTLCAEGFAGVSCSEAQTGDAPSSPAAAIGGAVGGAVVLAILVLLLVVLIVRRKRAMEPTKKTEEFDNVSQPSSRNRQQKNGASDSAGLYAVPNRAFRAEENDYEADPSAGASEYYGFSPRRGDLKIHELWDYIRTKMKNKCEEFFNEFGSIPHGLQFPHDAALVSANRIKNRYKDMYAYDDSRVKLQRDDEDETDYINACYIDGYGKVKKFIASQGPQKTMVNDFWEMVWQQKAEKIVMLTNVVEMGTQKCYEYFPESGEMSFGDTNIKFVESQTSLDYVIRTFIIDQGGKPSLTVKQFHFKSWPDKDVPDSAWALCNFWRTVNNTPPVNPDTPIVVHCSAGIGRTGTFIALDNLYNQARAEHCVRPLQMVETLRRQRVNMVQTKDQYVYLHQVVAEALLFGTHFVWTSQFEEFYHFMCGKDEDTGVSRIQQQYQLIVKSLADTHGEATSDPEYGNIESDNPESSEYRPKVGNRNSRTLQDLGALFLPNYAEQNVFMTVKSPTEKSLEEFWTVVAEQNVKTVVMLTSKSSVNYKTACSLGSNKNNPGQGKYTVNLLNQKASKGFTERNFTFSENAKKDDDLSTVRQYEYTAWKDDYNIPGDTHSMLDLIDAIYRWQPHPSESQPILVLCRNGLSRSGIVCVLLNEMLRMRRDDGHINIVDSVVRMKQRNPNLISDADQFRYCYDVIYQHINQSQVYQNL